MSASLLHRQLAASTAVVIALLVAACSGGGSTSAPSVPSVAPSSVAPSGGGASPSGADESIAPTKLVVGLGYIPSVQFAQFYLAEQRGYYTEAGLDIEFQSKSDDNLIPLVGQGAIDIGIGDGTSVIPAASNGNPIEYIATIYGKFPNIVFAKASSGIKTAADLKGKKIGVPGRYGSGWIMLQALLSSAGLTPDDVEIVEYPDYTQEIAVEQGAVDAATGYANNEPVQLQLHGGTPVVLTIDDITPLPGPGLVAANKTIDAKHDAIAGFVAATLHAMADIKADPTVGLDAAIQAVPELASARDAQAAILAATIATWSGPVQDGRGLGAIDRDGWTSSIAYLGKLGLVKNPVTTDQLVREDLLPPGD
ncbi:MAG TPA: ABC transporter substrate-binding protein [Candidatus Limnocylindrales bacterium]|nr:ABC transporter substrate-binding protein [Candidatus Limnocylindrales bacterium]